VRASGADLGVECLWRRLFLPNYFGFPDWSRKKLIFISGRFLFYFGELGVVGGYNFGSEANPLPNCMQPFWHYFACNLLLLV
jgi:hypothetical protein